VCCTVLLDAEDVSVEMSNLQLELSSFIDLDVTAPVNDKFVLFASSFFCVIKNYISWFSQIGWFANTSSAWLFVVAVVSK